ncbi:MAG: outer membrane protein assembly factor BamD [Flavobacteriaceae bacterium]|nr:outer membrane protein assembly factor BamD [Flavobacteriaceae bacterium]
MKKSAFESILIALLVSVFFMSCSDYQKLLGSNDSANQYKQAEVLYKSGDFKKASKLFERAAPRYRGTPQAERVIFLYADSYFNAKDYYLAAHQYENFIKSYPQSQKIIEAYYKEAICYYHLSPKFSLDQEDTYKAVEKLQIFINNFPNSQQAQDANKAIMELQIKLEKKEFEIARNYYTIRDYAAAIASFENFISSFPGNNFREESLYYKFLSSYQIAINSVESKKKERLEDLVALYNSIISYYPESIFLDDLNDKMEIVSDELSIDNQIEIASLSK